MNITKPPVAYRLSNTSAIIWWETDSTVTYGHGAMVVTTASAETFVDATTYLVVDSAGKPHCTHNIFLENLPAGALFSFAIVGPDFRASTYRSYVTPANNADVTFGVINSPEGYFGSAYPQLGHVLDKLGDVSAYLSCGNIAPKWDDATYEDWSEWYLSMRNYIDRCGMVVAKSSSDFGSVSAAMFPTFIANKSYYALTVGCTRIVVLDTSNAGRQGLADASQKSWAINQFNSQDWKSASYRIVMASNPFRTTLWDQSRSFGAGTGTDRYLLDTLYPLIQQSGADLAIFGQVHSYQRGVIESIYPSNEGQITHYLACGGVAPAHTVRAWTWDISQPPGIIVDSSDYHYVKIAATSLSMTVTSYNSDTDAVIDTFEVAPHQLY